MMKNLLVLRVRERSKLSLFNLIDVNISSLWNSRFSCQGNLQISQRSESTRMITGLKWIGLFANHTAFLQSQ